MRRRRPSPSSATAATSIGYLHFFVAAFPVHDMKTLRAKAITVGAIFSVAILGLAIFIPPGWI